MPSSCCAVNCTNRKKSGSSQSSTLTFYRIPNNEKRRQLWIAAIKRQSWSETSISNARVCSAHFISGKKSDDPTNPDYVPSVFAHNKIKESSQQQKLKRHERVMARRELSLECNLLSCDSASEHSATEEEPVETGTILMNIFYLAHLGVKQTSKPVSCKSVFAFFLRW